VSASEASKSGMTWTSTSPDAPGWYWLMNEGQLRTARPRPAEVYRDALGRLSTSGHTLGWWRDAGMRLWWCGPIAEPPDVMEAVLGAAKEAEHEC